MASHLVVATEALKRRKVAELEMERLQGTKFQLETQVTTLESASFNAETMAAMKTASDALKTIHGKLCVPAAAVLGFFISYDSRIRSESV